MLSLDRRLEIERQIVSKAVDCLLAAGYSLSVYNGEEPSTPFFTDREQVLAHLFACDEERLLARSATTNGWLLFVYGNGGYDVIADGTTNLEDVVQPANDLANALEEECLQ